MLWILLEAMIALALLLGVVFWLLKPQKKRAQRFHVAPKKDRLLMEREERVKKDGP